MSLFRNRDCPKLYLHIHGVRPPCYWYPKTPKTFRHTRREAFIFWLLIKFSGMVYTCVKSFFFFSRLQKISLALSTSSMQGKGLKCFLGPQGVLSGAVVGDHLHGWRDEGLCFAARCHSAARTIKCPHRIKIKIAESSHLVLLVAKRSPLHAISKSCYCCARGAAQALLPYKTTTKFVQPSPEICYGSFGLKSDTFFLLLFVESGGA